MKKILFTSLLLITPLCKAADFQNAMEALATGMTNLASEGFFKDVADNASLYFKAANPSNFTFLDSKESTDIVDKGLYFLDTCLMGQFNMILDLNGKKVLCKTYESSLSFTARQLTTIPVNINNLYLLSRLNLSDNHISAIPKNLHLPQLWYLYLENNHLQTIPDNFGHHFPNLWRLSLQYNSITTIPEDLNLPDMSYLYLNNNHIEYVNPQIINQFPKLRHLNLNQNPLTPENIKQLKDVAQEAGRYITIIADDIGNQYAPPGAGIKPAKKSEEEQS